MPEMRHGRVMKGCSAAIFFPKNIKMRIKSLTTLALGENKKIAKQSTNKTMKSRSSNEMKK